MGFRIIDRRNCKSVEADPSSWEQERQGFALRNERELAALRHENEFLHKLKCRLTADAETSQADMVRCVFNGHPMFNREIHQAISLAFPERKMSRRQVSFAVRGLITNGEVKKVGNQWNAAYVRLAACLVGLTLMLTATGCRFFSGGSYPAWEQKSERGRTPNPNPPNRMASELYQQRVDWHEAAKRQQVQSYQAGHTIELWEPPNRRLEIIDAPPMPTPLAVALATNWNVTLGWTHTSEVSGYQVNYGPTNRMTNVLTTSYTNRAKVSYPNPEGVRYFFNVRAFAESTDESGSAKLSLPSNTVKYPPDIIKSALLSVGLLAGPYTNVAQLFRFTNSPPEQEKFFKVTVVEERNYAP